jgi:hypothetical protein
VAGAMIEAHLSPPIVPISLIFFTEKQMLMVEKSPILGR